MSLSAITKAAVVVKTKAKTNNRLLVEKSGYPPPLVGVAHLSQAYLAKWASQF
jgi:hypothetical protein